MEIRDGSQLVRGRFSKTISRTVPKATFFIVIATLFFFQAILSAEDEAENKTTVIDSYVRYLPSRRVDAQSGKIEIVDSGAEYSYELKAFGKLPVKFSLATQYIGIEDTVEVELPSHLTGLITDIETTLPFFNFNQTYLRLGLSPSFYGDDWEFRSSQFRILSRYLFVYQPSVKWTLIGGIAVYQDFENEVLPVLGFIYKPNDRLAFNIIPKGPNISYLVNEKITLFAEGGSSFNREFELTKGDLDNAVLCYKESRLGAGLKFKLNRFIRSSVSAGAGFNRSLQYRDNRGKVAIKNGLYAEFRIEVAQ